MTAKKSKTQRLTVKHRRGIGRVIRMSLLVAEAPAARLPLPPPSRQHVDRKLKAKRLACRRNKGRHGAGGDE